MNFGESAERSASLSPKFIPELSNAQVKVMTIL